MPASTSGPISPGRANLFCRAAGFRAAILALVCAVLICTLGQQAIAATRTHRHAASLPSRRTSKLAETAEAKLLRPTQHSHPAIRRAAMRSTVTHSPILQQPRREVAVTFDDLPAPSDSVVSDDPAALQAMTSRLLADLKEYHVPAIGFVNEDKLDRGNFDERVAILKLWLNAGFGLGNHTYSHLDIDSTPLAAYELDFLRGEIVTQQLLLARKMRERYFRYPFLDVGATENTKRAFRQFLARQRYTVAPVTIDNQEYIFAAVYAHALATGDTETADRVSASFLSYMNAIFAYFEKFSSETLGYEPRQVLLLHADELDADEMPRLVKLMRARGYHFISLHDALRDPVYRLPDGYDDQMDGGVSWIEHWAHDRGENVPDGPDVPQYVETAYQKLQ